MFQSSDGHQSSAPRFCAEALESRVLLSASLVKDLNTAGAPGSALYTLGHVGKVAIFATDDGVHGIEPYRSDGTEAGTYLLRDIVGGMGDSNPQYIANLGNTLFFTVGSSSHGTLWKTDGTVSGTVKLANVFAGPSHVVVGNTLFFIGANRLGLGTGVFTALWKTDGSSAGTVELAGNIGGDNELIGHTSQMGALNGKIFFTAIDEDHGRELWRSDGTPEGTKLFADLVPGANSSDPMDFVATSDRLYFIDNIPNSSKQHLWKTDGTSAKLVETTGNKSSSNSIADLTAIGDRLYFTEDESRAISGFDSVWRTTGNAGTLLRLATLVNPKILEADPNGGTPDRIYVRETRPTSPANTYYSIKGDSLTAVAADANATTSIISVAQIGNDLYGTVRSGAWVSVFRGNSDTGTVLLKLFRNVSFAGDFTAVGSKVYFASNAPLTTSVLWITDGLGNGLGETVKDVPLSNAGSLRLQPDNTVVADSRLYFTPDTSETGIALWVSDGSPGGAHLTRDIDPRTAGSSSNNFTAGVGGTYFGAGGNIYLYNESTRKVQLLGSTGEGVSFIGKLGAAEIITTLHDIWRSDGTKAGTTKIFTSHTFVARAAIAGSNLYFDDGDNLFKSDGTASGTVPFKVGLHFFGTGVALKNSLIFGGVSTANNQSSVALWTTDGTTAGTRIIANLATSQLFNFGGAVYFFAVGKSNTTDLWRTDGTPKGTKLIKSGFGVGNKVAVTSDAFYFFNGVQLWSSDGTSSGTKLLKQFVSDVRDVFITAVGKRIYFPGVDNAHGIELWTSFAGKTVLLKDINPSGDSLQLSVDSGESESFVAVDTTAAPNGKMYFVAGDDKHGFELWETDATPTGTKLVKDIQPGFQSSTPMHLAVSGNTLLFSADDGVHGEEPWQFPLD